MSPKQQGLTGLLIAFVFALPLFVWSAINVNFNIREKADDEPNFCGGTCGSNYNCQANLFCFEGFCRNPICPSDTDCVCNLVTTTPTVIATKSSKSTPKTTLKPSPTITPQPKGGNETAYPIPVFTTLNTTAPTIVTTNDLKNQIWTDFAKYLIGMAGFIVICIILFIVIRNHRKNIKHIMPPTNI